MDRYAQLHLIHPELFTNHPDGIEILTAPDEVVAALTAARRASVSAAQLGVVYADPYITLLRDPVRFPDGSLGLHLRMLPSSGVPGAVVLPLLDNDVILLDHYRHPTRSWHLEAPRGMGEPEATPEQNAVRELSEELGTEPTALIPLGTMHPDTGLAASHVHLFAARIDTVGPVERAEAIRRAVRLPFAEAELRAADGRITCGFTLAVLYRARLAGLAAA